MSYEIDFENVDVNLHILALIRAGFPVVSFYEQPIRSSVCFV
jgi:hypothetical protein